MTGMRIRWMARTLARGLCLAALVACGCGDDTIGAQPSPEPTWPLLECDPLSPSYCGFPFPSDVFTVADASSATGRRVRLSHTTMPVTYYGQTASPDPWNQLDGFSPNMPIIAHFPGVTEDSLRGFASSVDIERSLEADSPTVLIAAQSGERIPHFVDLDLSTESPNQRAVIIRPAVRLQDATRYIVAIRGLTAGGAPIPASDAFAALRDRTAAPDFSVTERRELYDDIFGRLAEAGVDRSTLQLAWDYTTASDANNTDWLVHMRDEALELVGPDGPQYTITSVEDDYETDHIAYRIFGTMRVPMYLDQPGPGAHLVFGPDGLPSPNPAGPWHEYPFEILIPNSARTNPVALLQYGHGLLGEKEQIESSHFRSFIDEYNYAMFGIDFVGLAADDEVWIGSVMESGRFGRMSEMIDRQHQGMLNSLLAMRMMKRRFANDPMFGSMIDGDEAYYHGISQGGIFGGTYMALTTDVSRGALGVMGQPYSLLLTRSVDFDPFFEIIRATYPDGRDIQFLLSILQMLWDRTEPGGYTHHIRDNLLPNTPSHEVFMRAALGDHQVTTLGAHNMARTMGIPHLSTDLRSIYGLELMENEVTGSAYVEYDFGLPDDPVYNEPQRECEDPHGKLRKLEEARMQLDTFLRTGVVQNFCTGPCTFAEMSGCE